MGKLIQTKYADVSHRIIKKCSKKDNSSNEVEKVFKRKYWGPNDNEPATKLLRLCEEQKGDVEEQVPEESILEEGWNYFPENEFDQGKVLSEFNTSFKDAFLKIDDPYQCDLFFADELKNSHVNFIEKDFYFHIIDELCLEGLDGITFEAYWKRFSENLEESIEINRNIKEYIWNIIRKNPNLRFYQLAEPRRKLEIYNRYKYIDTEIGVVMELAYELPDIYPHKLVNDPNVKGSCSTFEERIDVSDKIKDKDYGEVELFGQKLIILASQNLRTVALLSELTDPLIEMQNMEYCILERIGRSRKHGLLTQGNMSISSAFKMDPKSVFHYKKQLYNNHLISKHFFYIKSVFTDQNKSGRLLQLKRFHASIKPKSLLVAEKVVDLLKKQPGYRMDKNHLRSYFGTKYGSIGKIFKSPEFRKFVKTDAVYPYRFMYPNAKPSEYMKKSFTGEKDVKCFELKNPHINLAASWNTDRADSDEDDEDVSDEEESTGGKLYNMEIIKEVYYHIYMSGQEGCSIWKIMKLTQVDKNTCRMVLKKLLQKNFVDIEKFDKGKQRALLYRAACFEKDGELPKPESQGTSTKPMSKMKAKLIERQRAARLKYKQEHQTNQDIIDDKLNEDSNMFPMVLEIEMQQIPNCYFLVKKFSTEVNIVSGTKPIEFNFHLIRDVIKLTYRQYYNEKPINLSEILNIDSSEVEPVIKMNFENYYSTKNNVNWITKLILLKSMFKDISINSDSLCLIDLKLKHSEEVTLPEAASMDNSFKSFDAKLQYMGDNPETVLKKKEGEVNVEIIVSSTPSQYKLEREYPKMKHLTERVAIRIQIILNIIHEKQILEDIHRIGKIIIEEELKTGYEKKIDRKSLARILKLLVTEGYIKIYKVVVSDINISKSVLFVCLPTIDHTDDQIQTSIQQMKWKYFIGSAKKTVKTNIPAVQKKLEETLKKNVQSPFNQTDVMSSIDELRKIERLKSKPLGNKQGRRIARAYGIKTKFLRMRILHEFLFYLIYEFKDNVEPLKPEEVKSLLQSYYIEVSDEDLQRLPNVYCNEISWKMFIPPLPHHAGWSDRWALMCDVILRLPISVFLKVSECSYEAPELFEILRHPIKRFYLVKDLPETIRNVVLHKRKYLFNIHDTICRLAYCGLLQFGPKKYKEKDQIFIYLNRRASLLNTTTSEPAYHQIEEKEYVSLSFFFNTQDDLEDYWYNMNGICMNTKLNARKPGEILTFIDVSAKPELVKTLNSRTPEEALENDNGEIPGDRRGAAGLDTTLWSHLTRNWFWASRATNTEKSFGLKEERMEKIPPQIKPFKDLGLITKNKKVYLHKTKQNIHVMKKVIKLVSKPTKTTRKITKYTRKITPRPKKSIREYHDAIDRVILKKIGIHRRIKWSSREDTVLMLCKVGDLFFYGDKTKKRIINYQVFRDVLHRICPESKYKTSRAVQRRLKKIQALVFTQLDEQVRHLYKIPKIADFFSLLASHITNGNVADWKLTEAHVNVAYVVLMSWIFDHEEEVKDVLLGNTINIDYLSKQHIDYTERESIELDKPSPKFEDHRNENDIKKNVLKSVIHSSLAAKDQSDVALQLLKVYQKFPDTLIREAVNEMKQSNTISCKKFNMKKDTIWQAPFHISQCYVFFQFTTFNATTALEAYKTFLALQHQKENGTSLSFSEETIDTKRYGQLLGINEFCSFWNKIQFEFELPQNVIILNPRISDHDELIHELAVRFQLKLKKLHKENKETEQEETESLRSKVSSDLDMIPTRKEEKLLPEKNTSSMDTDDIQNNPLDLTIDSGNSETIDRLKTWVTDCMVTGRERSPSPELMPSNWKFEVTDAADENTSPVEPLSVFSSKNDAVQELSSTPKKFVDGIPTLEEIKEEMLRISSNEDRRIPHITDLSDLLNKDNFSELQTDEKTLKRLKNHFITQYAALQRVIVEDSHLLSNHDIMDLLDNKMKKQKLWNEVEEYIVIGKLKSFQENFRADRKGSKDILGATGQQIKEKYSLFAEKLPLERIIGILVDSGVFLQAGICTITFVHHRYQHIWLAEIYQMTAEEQDNLLDTEETEEIPETIQIQLRQKKIMLVKVMPWYKIDGSLNKDTFITWLCNILSYCLEYPQVMFPKLCDKFCYLKPVDIHYLLEVLQELGCIEVLVYEKEEETLFSEWKIVIERPATILDNLDYCVIKSNNISMTCLGSFLYHYRQSFEMADIKT
ncbi:hypothetical protein JTB14_005068 [Gonioctena quinquepunctata]|nr:hypothetical protein JTB14_005068 [Gonioctena quinquepunctata]